jgi:hypothetical protein
VRSRNHPCLGGRDLRASASRCRDRVGCASGVTEDGVSGRVLARWRSRVGRVVLVWVPTHPRRCACRSFSATGTAGSPDAESTPGPATWTTSSPTSRPTTVGRRSRPHPPIWRVCAGVITTPRPAGVGPMSATATAPTPGTAPTARPTSSHPSAPRHSRAPQRRTGRWFRDGADAAPQPPTWLPVSTTGRTAVAASGGAGDSLRLIQHRARPWWGKPVEVRR